MAPRHHPGQAERWPHQSPIWYALLLAVLTAIWVWDGPPPASSLNIGGDRESARFARCGFGARAACVIDGDTFWYRGEKIRIADINTPETSTPRCDYEARLGERATRRLAELLNAGAFTLHPIDRETDQYGRTLRIVTRGGASLGQTLVAEGLAERWQGYRRDWC